MKVRNSLKSLRDRHQKNQLVRRRGRLYVINKTNKRFKARQANGFHRPNFQAGLICSFDLR